MNLPSVLVTARRGPGVTVNVREFPGNATVITSRELEEHGRPSLPDALKFHEGISVMDYSGFGLGADAAVNLRGVVNGSRTGALVIVDGVRQNTLTSDDVHWQSLPAELIERIEVVRGGGGILYGEGALSGVINIVTKRRASRAFEPEVSLERGSFGRRRALAAVRGARGPLTYSSAFQRTDIGGYRESTNARTTTVSQALGLEVLPELDVDLSVRHSEDTTYFSGGITEDASQFRRRQRGNLPGFSDNHDTQVSLKTTADLPGGFTLSAQPAWRWWESDIVTGFGTFATIAPAQWLTLSAAHDAEAGALRHTAVLGLELSDEKAVTGTRGSGMSESNKHGWGIFAEETLRLSDRVSLVAGARFDRLRYLEDLDFPAFNGTLRFEGWSPKAGISVDVAEPVTLYANVARPFKAPNVFDFSVAIPAGFVGNIDLREQQGIEYEAGVRARHPALGSAEAAWFASRVDDEILYNPLAFRNENFDTTRMGVELAAEPALPWARTRARLTYTFLEAEFRGGAFGDASLPGVPEHQFSAHVSHEPLRDLTVWLDWIVVHDFFRINDVTNSLPADNYGVLNVGLTYARRNTTFHFVIENATNEEYTTFQSSTGLAVSTGENPAPPLSVRGGVTVKF
ncbi:MAG TPA: TonB-dependent receptor [Gemmatimonadaceae bacterium]